MSFNTRKHSGTMRKDSVEKVQKLREQIEAYE